MWSIETERCFSVLSFDPGVRNQNLSDGFVQETCDDTVAVVEPTEDKLR